MKLFQKYKKIAPIEWALLIMAILLLLLCATAYIFALSKPNTALTNGPIGDYVGGLLNPVITSITFFALVFSILIQNKDLSLTRKELQRSAEALESQILSIEKQNFDNSFHNIISTFNSIVHSIDIYNEDTRNTISGRDCMRVFYDRLKSSYQRVRRNTDPTTDDSIVLNERV